jgi:dTDP-4-amino-4,6-dideoxygalactose transaminase
MAPRSEEAKDTLHPSLLDFTNMRSHARYTMYLLLARCTGSLDVASAWSPSSKINLLPKTYAVRHHRSSMHMMSITEREATEEMMKQEKTILTKNIKQADPIPEAGILQAVELMQQGKLYRYNVPTADESMVSVVEKEIGEYTGHSYVVGLNSCGSALFLALKAAGVQPGDKVLTNAFTFTAVPSAIEHSGGEAVYVETDAGFRIDVSDLEKKMQKSSAKYLMVSHMRGKIADMDAIVELCAKHSVYLIEDAAHSIGVLWEGKHTGHHGRIAAISSQSYKMLNSGEGGFLVTNDPEAGAAVAVYAGAYEALHSKHLAVPDASFFGDLSNQLPNYSLRMHAVTAAMIRPQIATIDERRERYNVRYYALAERLNALPGVTVPEQLPQVTIVGDSVQFTLATASSKEIGSFMASCKSRNLPVELFGDEKNARYFKNWKFAPTDCELPQTERIIKSTFDVRMPLMWDDSDFDDMYAVIVESLGEAGIN